MDILDFGLYVGYALLIVAVLVAIGMPLAHVANSPAILKQTGIAIGSLLILGIISFAVSSSNVTPQQASMGVTPLESRFIGAGLIMLYIVLTIGVIVLIYSEVHKATK